MTAKRLLFACALAAITSFSVLPNLASATLLSTLTAGGTITVGDLVFANFSYLNTGDMPTDSGVNVVTYTDAAGDTGLMFQGAFIDFLGGSGSDALIGFSVTETTIPRPSRGPRSPAIRRCWVAAEWPALRRHFCRPTRA